MGYGNDPDSHGNRRVQALDCLEDLAPPLRLARIAFYEARDGLKRNVPETVAHQTGGEYFPSPIPNPSSSASNSSPTTCPPATTSSTFTPANAPPGPPRLGRLRPPPALPPPPHRPQSLLGRKAPETPPALALARALRSIDALVCARSDSQSVASCHSLTTHAAVPVPHKPLAPLQLATQLARRRISLLRLAPSAMTNQPRRSGVRLSSCASSLV